ncbi:FAD-dependent oxidoreductase [Geomonas sp. Red32]|uniref:FAD-dependent oxidoreductase n=1 Tax=Geomonas sp. Red32 TaxID=2912856 RepID=UPI00202CBC04|nr:FAD-dependent oxidoreductase [Geomonas sp. Red32]MCM0083505.1 FAD-dependent oxidoreductase [Geomonas sp. Red32]
MMGQKYLIVGGVAGGMSAAARLRRIDEESEIVVFERGDYVSYANCGLPYYLGGAITERSQLLLQTPQSFHARFRVDVRTGHEVVAVDADAKKVRVRETGTGKESEESFDKLLLAPGGSPVRPPIPGCDLPEIHTLWTIPDTDRLHELLSGRSVSRALVVGGGFIGLEMVENLHALGIGVTLVEATAQVMVNLDFEMAALVHRELRMKGVPCLLEDAVQEFAPAPDGGVTATLVSGTVLEADLVLLAVGVAPNTSFLAGSGIELGKRGHILVDEQMRTSRPDVFAVGDAIEVTNPFTGKSWAVPLAGPANKQGRIAADNMNGAGIAYRGTMGTSIAKVFDLDAGGTGATEKFCRAEGIPCASVIIHPNDHAGYYPGATPLTLKLVFSTENRKVLGAQVAGYGGVDKRIDVIATAIKAGMTVDDLCEIEHAYAPPYSSAKDPVNMAGFVAQNVLDGLCGIVTWDRIDSLDRATHFVLDVRDEMELGAGTIAGAVNIPLNELRGRLGELPRDKTIVIFCKVGLRGYLAARILTAHGFTGCLNLSGGWDTYCLATTRQSITRASEATRENERECIMPQLPIENRNVVKVNACGLQCPGPIMRLKQEMDVVAPGGVIEISASDPGFHSDVQAWARATGNQVKKLESSKGTITALVEKGHHHEVAVTTNRGGNDKTIIVFSGDLDKVIASFVIANGALSMGRKVTMFFTFWGLNALRKPESSSGLGKNLIEAAFGMMMPRGSRKLSLSRMSMGGIGGKLIRGIMKNKNVPSLEDMIQLAIRGGAQLVACQMSMDLMGIRAEELIEGVQFGGVAAYLEASEHADNNLFI